MRKIIIVWCLVLTVILSGCGTVHLGNGTLTSTDSVSHTADERSQEDETKEPGASTIFGETDDVPSTTESPPEAVGTSTTTTTTNDETQGVITTDIPETSDKETETSAPNTTETMDKATQTEETTAPSTEKKPVETKPEETKPQETESVTEWVPTVYANGSNCSEICTLIIQYINEYRISEGTVGASYLPGLSEYAQYRSTQLVSNFAHDTADERAAATALKYGEYVDPSVYGLSGDPYYTSCAREAIAFTGKVGTVDEVAKHIATMMLNSSEHWVYVGSGDYAYVGVGLTYKSGYWYCDIAMSKVNNG